MNITPTTCSPKITIASGYALVPDGPGLGVAIDEEALARLRMDPPYRVDYPRTILTYVLPGGRSRHYATMTQLWADCRAYGNVPLQPRGATLEVRHDDGTAEFAKLYERANRAPVLDVQ